MTPEFAGIRELRDAMRRRRLSPVELLDHILARIARLDPSLHAYLALLPTARTEARRAERAYAAGRTPGPIAGIPISIKDLILTRDSPATAGSRAFGDGVTSDHDAPVARRLRRAGAVIIGRANLHEVALGVTTVNEHFGAARNPHDTSRVSGGSSGGSAVAVAAGLCTGSVGTDTRGSIRIPAACCGITGLKPTRGLVSTDGVIPLSTSLDHVGPMTRSVEDAAILLGAMTGSRRQASLERAASRSPRRLRVGISEYHLRDLDRQVQRSVDDAITELGRLGITCRAVRLPGLDGVQEASVVITAAEAVTVHDQALRTNPEAFGPLVRSRLEGGYAWSAVAYLQAQEVRARAETIFARAFEEVDILVGATIPALPPRIDEQSVHINGVERNIVESFTRLNSAQNMAGVPAMSVPCGFSRDGMPVGMQLIAAHGNDDRLIVLGGAFQRATDWHQRRPRLD